MIMGLTLVHNEEIGIHMQLGVCSDFRGKILAAVE